MNAGIAAARRVAVTGAAGSLASDIIPGLIGRGYEIIGIDQRSPLEHPGFEWVECSITDRTALRRALEGCDAVIHLAGIPLESDWDRLLHANIDGTQAVLETARGAGVRRAILASSIHAVGYVEVPPGGDVVPDDVAIRPNTFYGVTKAALEALGSLYHHRHGMDVICLRIASRTERPLGERMLSTWLSPADAERLFHACLIVPSPGFRTVWGVSSNTRGYLASDGGAAIGYCPEDDAETHAPALLKAARTDRSVLASEWDHRFIGGIFSSPEPPTYTPPTTGTTGRS